MLIINADDWGRSAAETDAALRCYKAGRITSASAMVFMEDSERAADLGKETELDIGLHLNFTERFTAKRCPEMLRECHQAMVQFLTANKYCQLFYNPFLGKRFLYSYGAQTEEFVRLYNKPPSHIDGHHHMHLCANMLFTSIIPAGMKVRRNFSFSSQEKGSLNRLYRSLVDHWLARRYFLADYFFDLTQCIQLKKWNRVAALAKSNIVELMTHPIVEREEKYLLSDEFGEPLQKIETGGYALV
jgi:chitin disaccharide deacetylase